MKPWIEALTASLLSVSHTQTPTRRPTPLSIPHTCHKRWMIASSAWPAHSRGRLITHMILEIKWLATWSCFPSRSSERVRDRASERSTSVPDTGFLTTRVTMDMCFCLETHGAALCARWMMINHLIYEQNGLSVACFLTCNDVTAPQQLRKMPGTGLEEETSV